MKTQSAALRTPLSLADHRRGRTLPAFGRLMASQRLLRRLRKQCPEASRRAGSGKKKPCLVVLSGAAPADRAAIAQRVASALGRPLQPASQYIGETEKNLERALNRASQQAVVLFFDEADALLGGRTEVSDSHDRYANVEVSYLLQHIEAYRGIVLMSTNGRNNNGASVRGKAIVLDL